MARRALLHRPLLAAALARGARRFHNACAQDSNTGPSHATLFTGLYPPQHGAVDNNVPLPPGRGGPSRAPAR